MIPIRDDAPRFTTPYVNYFLVAMNVVVFLFELLLPSAQRNQLMYLYGFIPAHVTRFLTAPHAHMSAEIAFVPVLTSMFLHASWLHLIFNMWALWIFGDNIEDYVGHFRYLIFYLLSGLGAALLHTVLNPAATVPSVGASGAIAGVMGAYLVLFPSARVLTLVPLFIFFTFINLPAWLVLGYWFVVQFLSGAATSIAYSQQTSGGIAFWAHVGGFVTGIALIKLFPTRPRRYRFARW
jgi:membrane associated rhomboid family serine protease